MANVYTKTGDKGQTGLVGGNRVWKDDTRVHCYGTLDEANSMIGVAYSICENEEVKKILNDIQKKLFVLGAEIASDEQGEKHLKEKIEERDIQELEKIIDYYIKKIGPQREFVIPGKTTASAILHVARTIIRRGERMIVKLQKEGKIREKIYQYTNRLSDTLFVLARVEETSIFVKKVKDQVIQKLRGNEYKLDLCIAKKMAEAAEAKAKSIGIPIVFSVVDEGGNLLLLHRMEDALLASIDISINKAYTAAFLKLPTHELAKISKPGEMLYGIQNMNRMIIFGGGYPLKAYKKFIGGIGVSGGSVEEDMIIASHALRVFEMEK